MQRTRFQIKEPARELGTDRQRQTGKKFKKTNTEESAEQRHPRILQTGSSLPQSDSTNCFTQNLFKMSQNCACVRPSDKDGRHQITRTLVAAVRDPCAKAEGGSVRLDHDGVKQSLKVGAV